MCVTGHQCAANCDDTAAAAGVVLYCCCVCFVRAPYTAESYALLCYAMLRHSSVFSLIYKFKTDRVCLWHSCPYAVSCLCLDAALSEAGLQRQLWSFRFTCSVEAVFCVGLRDAPRGGGGFGFQRQVLRFAFLFDCVFSCVVPLPGSSTGF